MHTTGFTAVIECVRERRWTIRDCHWNSVRTALPCGRHYSNRRWNGGPGAIRRRLSVRRVGEEVGSTEERFDAWPQALPRLSGSTDRCWWHRPMVVKMILYPGQKRPGKKPSGPSGTITSAPGRRYFRHSECRWLWAARWGS